MSLTLRKLIRTLDFEVINEGDKMDEVVAGGYVGDLLSDVISSGKQNDIWVTIQAHENIIAVATLKDLIGIVLSKNINPLPETLEAAQSENVTLLRSPLNSFQIVAKLAEMGISGDR